MSKHRVLATLVAGVVAATITAVSPANGVGFPLTRVVSDNPVNSTPHVLNGTVRAIAEVGDRVYVGGQFTSVQNPNRTGTVTRNHLFAYDRSSGAVVSSFAPRLDGAVESVAVAPDGNLIVAGRFRTVNGATQRSLALLDANGNRVTSFTGRTNGIVNKVLVRGNRLLVAGRFGTAGASGGNVSRTNLAGFDFRSNAVDGLNLPVTVGRTKPGKQTTASVLEMDADAAGNRLVLIGNFRQVGDQRRQQIAMINLTAGGGALASWYTNRFPNGVSTADGGAYQCYQSFDTAMRDVEFSPDGSYFAVVTTGGAGDRNSVSLCDTLTRWSSSASGPATEVWKNCTGGDTLYSVSVTNAAIYVGGHQRWMDNCGGRDNAVAGSVARDGVAAVDPSSGRALPWNPGRPRGVGAEELVATSAGLYIGSDTQRLGGEFHGRLGLFPAG
jgi:hypothetical protein